VIKAIRPNICL